MGRHTIGFARAWRTAANIDCRDSRFLENYSGHAGSQSRVFDIADEHAGNVSDKISQRSHSKVSGSGRRMKLIIWPFASWHWSSLADQFEARSAVMQLLSVRRNGRREQ